MLLRSSRLGLTWSLNSSSRAHPWDKRSLLTPEGPAPPGSAGIDSTGCRGPWRVGVTVAAGVGARQVPLVQTARKYEAHLP
jgi:hypothetical protein